MTLFPRTTTEVVVRCDIYAREGYHAPAAMVERWKWMLEKELTSLSTSNASDDSTRSYFAYQCGGRYIVTRGLASSGETDTPFTGRTIDLFAILAQHQRSEKMARRKLQPAIRVTATLDIDTAAAALCDALDGMGDSPSLEKCARTSSIPQTLEW